jgi:hypothetical protein
VIRVNGEKKMIFFIIIIVLFSAFRVTHARPRRRTTAVYTDVAAEGIINLTFCGRKEKCPYTYTYFTPSHLKRR